VPRDEGGEVEKLTVRAARAREAEGGFTLIELLVVIIIIAILAAIAVPTFLGHRQKAQDAECKSLVRNGVSTIEAGYVDTRTFVATVVGMRAADLKKLEPSLSFVVLGAAATNPTAKASAGTVNYTGTATTYSIGALSASGKRFGMAVNKGSTGTLGVRFYVNGAVKNW
jgi:type IV pilus assembly protein PilA